MGSPVQARRYLNNEGLDTSGPQFSSSRGEDDFEMQDYQINPSDGLPGPGEAPPPDQGEEPKAGRMNKMKGLFGRGNKDKDTQEGPSEGSKPSKLKGFFKRGKGKEDPDPEIPPGSNIEDSQHGTPQQFDMHPGSTVVNPSMTLTRTVQPSKVTTMKSGMKNILSPKEKIFIPQGEGIAELHPMPDKTIFRSSNVITLMLVILIVLGIILTAMSNSNPRLQIIGPLMLGLSAFAIVGKIYFSIFYDDEPFPKLSPYLRRYEEKFKPQPRIPPPSAVMYPPPSVLALNNGGNDGHDNHGINMDPLSSYNPRTDRVYDETIDTTPRLPSAYPQTTHPAYQGDLDGPPDMRDYRSYEAPPTSDNRASYLPPDPDPTYDQPDFGPQDGYLDMTGGYQQRQNFTDVDLEGARGTDPDPGDVQLPSSGKEKKEKKKGFFRRK